MVKRFTICDGFLIDRKIVTLTSFYNDRYTKNNRMYGHPAKFCVEKQKCYGGIGVNQRVKCAGSIDEVVARQPFYLWGMFICNNRSHWLSDWVSFLHVIWFVFVQRNLTSHNSAT